MKSTEIAYQSYLDKIKSKIEFHKTYPKASKLFKENGTVQLRIELIKSGQVQKIEVMQSSQFKRLDEAAIKAIANAAPFDKFPSDIKLDSWSIFIPVRFELASSSE